MTEYGCASDVWAVAKQEAKNALSKNPTSLIAIALGRAMRIARGEEIGDMQEALWIGDRRLTSDRPKRDDRLKDGKPWVVFRFDANGNPLGYFWGPGYEKESMRGQPIRFGMVPEAGGLIDGQ